MKLSMSYAEFSFLRELVKEKQMDIWEKIWLPRLKKGVDAAEAFNEKMNRPSIIWDTISSNEDCCNMLIRRFDEMEREFQKIVGREL